MKILNNKKVNCMLGMIAANYIIGIDALKKADMPEKHFADSVDKLTSNTIDLASMLYGQNGIQFIHNMAKKYGIYD